MSRSIRVRPHCIKTVKQAVQRNGFPNQRSLAEAAGMAVATVNNFLNGKPVDRATFVELCDKLALDYDRIAQIEPTATKPPSFEQHADPQEAERPSQIEIDQLVQIILGKPVESGGIF